MGCSTLIFFYLKKMAPTYRKHGNMRRTHLTEQHEGFFISMLLSGKSNAHLNEINDAANTRINLIMKLMAKAQSVTEEFKAKNQMA